MPREFAPCQTLPRNLDLELVADELLPLPVVSVVGAVVDRHHVRVPADHREIRDTGVGDGVRDGLTPLGKPDQSSAPEPAEEIHGVGFPQRFVVTECPSG